MNQKLMTRAPSQNTNQRKDGDHSTLGAGSGLDTLHCCCFAVLALTVALLTVALVPVDIFLVSYMKEQDGTFKEWANDSDTRDAIENMMLYAYYTMYALEIVFMFLVLPFMYFYYEEYDEDSTTRSRICAGLKFTIVFVFVAGVLLLVGAFIPTQATPSMNETEWEKLQDLFEGLGKNRGENALSFCISILTLIGMLLLVIYTAYGMNALPIDMIFGTKSAKDEIVEVQGDYDDIQSEIAAIRHKYKHTRRSMSRKDRTKLNDLQDKEKLIKRRERHLEKADKSWCTKCSILWRPFEILTGIILSLLALLILLSLLLTSIDKLLHSLGPKTGYILPQKTLPNPLDITLVYCQAIFPLDYVLMCLIIVYFVVATMAGIRKIGIWFFCLRMFKIRPHKTKTQGLLFMCEIMMLIILALNVMFYNTVPQYVTFGSQKYIDLSHNDTVTVEQCNTGAPRDECVMTQMSTLLTKYFYQMWVFGACYYWANWAFMGIFLLGLLVALCKKRRSAIDGEVDKDDDSDDSDDELLPV
ncbi:lysosomal cobalamin transport escort protein LMBD1-like isoform X2 [Ptychodera flava]|uniref:lysosomal cobalamin transport escort protein LMBD1-like isoform X2 n=1 Tax=Ptychodera flava TaxID=63121 RepID=UPI00396A46B9